MGSDLSTDDLERTPPRVVDDPALEKILCVDDDPNILDAFKRQFRKQFNLETAVGGAMGLGIIARKGPFAVVISDLRMPEMDGVKFLAAVRSRSPDTVRIMLTGHADLSAAIAAVNQGSIFRFLVKPCAPTVLTLVIEAALEQYRLVTAEKQLTEKTLLGCVKLLMEILGVVQPDAFSRAARLRQYVGHMAASRASGSSWRFETAAMLSQIGWITLPPELVEKLSRREPLSAEEEQKFAGHPVAARKMLEHIPRLETVGAMIEGQTASFADWTTNAVEGERLIAALGAQMLKVAMDFDELRQTGLSDAEALARMKTRPGVYNPELLAALESMFIDSGEQTMMVSFDDLAAGMISDQDVRTKNGVALLAKGQEITPMTYHRLLLFKDAFPSDERVRVRVRKS